MLNELTNATDALEDHEVSALLEVTAALVDRRCAADAVEVAAMPWLVDPEWTP